MNDLDNLKGLWKEQKFNSVDQDRLFSMIHKKSKNSLKWLHIITVVELLLTVFFTVLHFINPKLFSLKNKFEGVSETYYMFYEFLMYIGLLFSIIMVVLVYYFYNKTKVNLSVAALLNNITRFRKYIHWTIFAFTFPSAVFFSVFYYQVIKNVYLESHPNNLEGANLAGWIGAGVSMVIFIVLIGIYYGIIYGVFLRRLNKNRKELMKMEVE